MKKILFAASLLFITVLVQAQAITPVTADALQLTETEYQFGKIPQGKPVYHVFVVRNTSDSAFKLDNVTASCGCTTPEWSQEMIAPGASAQIKVGYNAASEGGFDKYITITYKGNQTKMIRIKGEVWKAPAGAAPANAPVQFLKQTIQ